MKTLYKITDNETKFRGIFNSETLEDAFENVDVNGIFSSLLSRLGVEDFEEVKEVFGVGSGVDKANDALENEVDDENEENPSTANDINISTKNKTVDKKLEESIKNGEMLSAEDAIKRLNPEIGIRSTKHKEVHRNPDFCKERSKTDTSLMGIRPKTIAGINFLQEQLNIPLVITGGTEDGHGGGLSGKYGTHGGGYKLDISLEDGVDSAIKSYIGRETALGKGKFIGTKNRKSGKFSGEYKTWVINDGGYKMTITQETGVKGGAHFDIKFE